MAIRAQKDALLRLGTKGVERERDTLRVQLDELFRRIDVVEVERPHRLRVPAPHASAPCLFDEDPLHLAPTARDRLRATLSTPVVAPAVYDELGFAVSCAHHLRFTRAVLARDT